MATDKSGNVNRAVQMIHAERGLASKIAKRCKITRPAVHMWKTVPPRHAVTVAKMLNLPVHCVCPEVFPPPRRLRSEPPKTRGRKKTQPEPEVSSVKSS